MRVLAIESTCDETGACVAETFGNGVRIISETKATSAEITSKYGGIVPEVVAREQVAAMIPVIETALQRSEIRDQSIDGIAVSFGPGLVGSLLIGVETAKTLAWAWDKKLYGVNHMVGHIFSNWIVGEKTQNLENPKNQNEGVPELPAVALVVSGGHTDLVLLKSLTDWQWIGGTRDDAVGEAFDKVARVMCLPYPGGPAIAKMAMEFSILNSKFSSKVKLPRPMINEPGLEMSFSGLKTAVLQRIMNNDLRITNEDEMRWLAYEFNNAVVDVLVNKTMRAVEAYQPKSVILAGGVAANELLRKELAENLNPPAGGSKTRKLKVWLPELKYTTDNAAMIAAAALMRPIEVDTLHLRPDPSLGVV